VQPSPTAFYGWPTAELRWLDIKVLMQADSSLWPDFVVGRAALGFDGAEPRRYTSYGPAITQVLTQLARKMRQ